MSNSTETPLKTYDYVGKIIDLEDGNLDEEQTIELFQYLIDKGIVFSLQGSYQRTAQHLIDNGICTPKGA